MSMSSPALEPRGERAKRTRGGLPAGGSDGMQQIAGKALLAAYGGLTLRVTQGVHAGATMTASGPSLEIGSGLANDVVLIGDRLSERHVRLSLSEVFPPRIRLEAIDGPVRLADGRALRPGHHLDLPLPLRFQAGGADCVLEGRRDLSALLRKAAPVAAVVVGLALIPALVSGLFSGASSLFGAAAPTYQPVATSAADGGRAVDPGVQQRWQEALQARLRDSGLGDRISIERGASGSLVAVGDVEDARVDAWRDIVKWFDAQGAGPLLVNNVTRAGAGASLPGLRAVWLEGTPQVVLSNGQFAGVGDTIGGGWRIDSIDKSGVALSRDGRVTRLTF